MFDVVLDVLECVLFCDIVFLNWDCGGWIDSDSTKGGHRPRRAGELNEAPPRKVYH